MVHGNDGLRHPFALSGRASGHLFHLAGDAVRGLGDKACGLIDFTVDPHETLQVLGDLALLEDHFRDVPGDFKEAQRLALFVLDGHGPGLEERMA